MTFSLQATQRQAAMCMIYGNTHPLSAQGGVRPALIAACSPKGGGQNTMAPIFF